MGDTGPVDQLGLLNAAMASASRPLPAALRKEAESFYQNDLSSARLHDNPVAQSATTAMGAQAMTVGTHIFMPPAAVGNMSLMGHELGHVNENLKGVRETGNNNGSGVTVTDPNQNSEQKAERDGVAFAAGAGTAPSVVAQRAVLDDTVQRTGPGGVAGEAGGAVQRRDEEAAGLRHGGHEGGAHGGLAVQRAGHRDGHRDGGGRQRRPQRVRVSSLRHAEYIQSPSYGQASRRGGGTEAHAILGPLGFWDVNSDANPRLPPAIDDARDEYRHETFIAGHMLNACFGGPGNSSKNITILTSGANSRMKSFDNPIKTAMRYLGSIYDRLSHLYMPIDQLRFGIEVLVQPAGYPYVWDRDSSPGKYISSYISCRATVRGSSMVSDWIEDALRQDPYNPEWQAVNTELGYVLSYVDRANMSDLIDNSPRYALV
ncbi:eCIS core domain-containing protein [Streptomyces sp. NBC_00388]|uniref:eCIS core domain-containing protein n=1 Tax=Streptomyces sp. NBC_00388 TaxID=2975735 RepID=UPI002E1FE049